MDNSISRKCLDGYVEGLSAQEQKKLRDGIEGIEFYPESGQLVTRDRAAVEGLFGGTTPFFAFDKKHG